MDFGHVPNDVKRGANTDFICCEFDPVCPGLISVGTRCTLSHARLLTHDSATCKITGYAKLGWIIVGDGSVVGYKAIIMYDTIIGNNCIVQAGSVVVPGSRFPDGIVIGGNPAKFLCSTDNFSKKRIAWAQKNEINLSQNDVGLAYKYIPFGECRAMKICDMESLR